MGPPPPPGSAPTPGAGPDTCPRAVFGPATNSASGPDRLLHPVDQHPQGKDRGPHPHRQRRVAGAAQPVEQVVHESGQAVVLGLRLMAFSFGPGSGGRLRPAVP